MSHYKFLLKPFFFIFNLFFATWLVLKIEQVKPSDFGRNRNLFEQAPPQRIVTMSDRTFLINLAKDYANGRIDSLILREKIESYLTIPSENEKTAAELPE